MKPYKYEAEHISLDEERIKILLKSDVESAAKQTGDWKEIASSAYDSGAQVRRGGMTFVFPAICAAVVAVTVSAVQMFYFNSNEIESAMGAPDEASLSSQTDYSACTSPEIIAFSTRCSTDENGSALTGNYSLEYDFVFPEIEGQTDYGRVYTYVICEGEVLYSSSEASVFYRAGKTDTVSNVNFSMKQYTTCATPEVTVISAFFRTSGNSERLLSTASTTLTLENPLYDYDATDLSYLHTETDCAISRKVYYQTQVDSSLKISKLSDSEESLSDSKTDYSDYAAILSCAGNSGEYDLFLLGADYDPKTVSLDTYYREDTDSQKNMELVCETRVSLDGMTDLKRDAKSGERVFLAAIPRDGGDAIISPIYDLRDFLNTAK